MPSPGEYGLISSMGEGFKSFFQTYMQERNRQDTLRQQNLANALSLQKEGKEIVPGTEGLLNPQLRSSPSNDQTTGFYKNILTDQYKQTHPKATLEEISNFTSSMEGLNPTQLEKGGGLLKPEYGFLAKTMSEQSKKDNPKDKTGDYLKDAISKLEGARGNPAAAQAERDLYAVAKARGLTKAYSDLNQMPQQQVQLLASEIAKIAKGGVSDQAELHALTPNSISQKLSTLASNVTNRPTPANAGAFIKEYQKYLDTLESDAQEVIQDKYGRIIESMRPELGESGYQRLNSQYLGRFSRKKEASSSKKGPAAGEVSQNGWIYDAKTHKPLREDK